MTTIRAAARRRVPSVAALAFALAAAGLAGGCASGPRAGPRASELSGSAEAPPPGLVAPLTAEVAAVTAAPPPPGFPSAFRAADPLDVERLGVGDRISVTVWEGGERALLGGAGGMSELRDLEIGGDGAVRAPFVGAVRAAGATPGALADRLRDAFAQVAVAPEVDVRLSHPGGRLVSVQGAVASPGVYPVERATRRLLPMLAVAGGATLPPEQVEVALRRGDVAAAETLADIYADPALDVALRPGDGVVVSAVRKRFVALGATTTQIEVPFPTRELDLLRALATVRGLRDLDADPSAVFVLRYERPEIAEAVLDGPPPPGLPVGPMRPVVYHLDMTEPGALFVAQRFAMRDGDAVYVSNAPLAELRKVVQIFTSVLTPVQQTAVIAP